MALSLQSFDTTARAVPQSRLGVQEQPRALVQKSSTVRKCEITSLKSDGTVHVSEQIIPANPRIEAAFSAFASGTHLDTEKGPVAVEALRPGMNLTTAEYGPSPILWIGSITLLPRINDTARIDEGLVRVMADTYGMLHPNCDLIAGPGARILARSPNPADAYKSKKMLMPVRKLTNGVNVFEIMPPRPVQVYHVCLPNHATLTAAGLEVESYHPGYGFEHDMSANLLTFFMSLFPHIKTPEDFGRLAHPRQPL